MTRTMTMHALLLALSISAWQGVTADTPPWHIPCNGHNHASAGTITKGKDIDVTVSMYAGLDAPEDTDWVQLTSDSIADLDCVCANGKVYIKVEAFDKDKHVCEAMNPPTRDVDNYIVNSALKVNVASSDSAFTADIALTSPEGDTKVFTRTWTATWDIPSAAGGKHLKFAFTGKVDDMGCDAFDKSYSGSSVKRDHRGSKDESHDMGVYKAKLDVVKVEIVTDTGVAIEQGEAYTMTGSITPADYVKKWRIWQVTDKVQIDADTGRITFTSESADAPIRTHGTVVTLYARDCPECLDSYDITFIPFSRPGVTAHTGDALLSSVDTFTQGDEKEDNDPKEGDMGFVYLSTADKCQGRRKHVHRLRYEARAAVSVGGLWYVPGMMARAGAAYMGSLDNDWPIPKDGVAVRTSTSSLPVKIPLGWGLSYTPTWSQGESASAAMSQPGVIREDNWQDHVANEPVDIHRLVKISTGYSTKAANTGWASVYVSISTHHEIQPADIMEWKPRIPVP